MAKPPFVLIHSPLVGALTWQFVAEHLQALGDAVHTPELIDHPQSALPLWQQEVNSLDVPVQGAMLVGHSGAGALLPAIGEKLKPRGYIFVDAVIQFKPATRLDLLRAEDAQFAQEFEQYLESGGQFPNWQDEQLQSLIPDDDLRGKLLADLRPRGLNFFTELIDVPPDWDALPCGYIQLSETYATYAAQAASRGWDVIRRDGHHFEMLTHPDEIAQLLIEMAQRLQ